MADNKNIQDSKDRNKVSTSEEYEIQYFKEKLGVTADKLKAAIKATGSNDRKTLEAYFKKNK